MLLCRPCHTHVHRVGSNDELAETLNTAERILAHPAVQKFLAWRTAR
jgi:predicted transcriptional regulator